MSILEIQHISKVYQTDWGKVQALDDISFRVLEGEFVCILGVSGCGKTTLLRILAGLEHPTAGAVLLRGQKVVEPSRDWATVFQEPLLFPWLTVEDNVAFGLKGFEEPKTVREIVTQCLDMINLTPFAKAYPHELSGGMAHRVSLARAFAINPKVLYLDEPFSSLDQVTKNKLQGEVIRIWKLTGKTMLMVTHDIDEALMLSQRIMIMGTTPGHIIQDIRVRFAGSGETNTEEYVRIKEKIIRLLNE